MAINKVIILGNLGKDPDVRRWENGGVTATFSVATSERAYTMRNGTQVPERTEWHNIVLHNGLAEVAEKYLHKGDKVYIEGKIRTRSYDDQNGQRRYVTEIHCENMEMLSPKGQQGQGYNAPAPQGNPYAQSAPKNNNQTSNSQPVANAQSAPVQAEEESDDLPF